MVVCDHVEAILKGDLHQGIVLDHDFVWPPVLLVKVGLQRPGGASEGAALGGAVARRVPALLTEVRLLVGVGQHGRAAGSRVGARDLEGLQDVLSTEALAVAPWKLAPAGVTP